MTEPTPLSAERALASVVAHVRLRLLAGEVDAAYGPTEVATMVSEAADAARATVPAADEGPRPYTARRDLLLERATSCVAGLKRGVHPWSAHVEAIALRLIEAVERSGESLAPDDSADAYEFDCEVPLVLNAEARDRCDGCGASVLSTRHFEGCPLSPAADADRERLATLPRYGLVYDRNYMQTMGRDDEGAYLRRDDVLRAGVSPSTGDDNKEND